MISNQLLQNTIDGIKNIAQMDLSILDKYGSIVASTDYDIISSKQPAIESFVLSPAESQAMQGAQYFKVFDGDICEYVIKADGESDECYRIGKITAFQIQNLLVAYKERYDKDNFIKNLLLDNFLLIDIYNRAKKFELEINEKRIVFVIQSNTDMQRENIDAVKALSFMKPGDFITSVEENHVIIIKELRPKDKEKDIESISNIFYDIFTKNTQEDVHLAIGTVVTDLKDVSRSYKEAKMAMEVGKVFAPDKNIMDYSALGIGRLIYQLPIPLCKTFLKEVLGDLTGDDFDDETQATISKFFECSLNVSETARQLYIHRNTLVYRLDKLQKITKLDLRTFEDALTFKIALMVSKFTSHFEEKMLH